MKKMNKSEYQDDQKLRAKYQKVLISKAMREIRDEEADSLLECSPEDQRYLEFLEANREKRLKKMMRRLRWISLKKQFFTVVPRNDALRGSRFGNSVHRAYDCVCVE